MLSASPASFRGRAYGFGSLVDVNRHFDVSRPNGVHTVATPDSQMSSPWWWALVFKTAQPNPS